MKKPNRELYHNFIINDLLLKSLELDKNKLESFKIKYALDEWFEHALLKVENERKRIAAEFRNEGIRFEKREEDDGFSQFNFKEKGLVQSVRYSNVALRNQVNEAAKELLNLPARKFDHSP